MGQNWSEVYINCAHVPLFMEQWFAVAVGGPCRDVLSPDAWGKVMEMCETKLFKVSG